MDRFQSDGERIYILWDKYARERDVEGLVSLYAHDAVLETPLIPAILDVESGTLKGILNFGIFLKRVAAVVPTNWSGGTENLDVFFSMVGR